MPTPEQENLDAQMLGQFRFEHSRPLLLQEKRTGNFGKKRKDTEEKLCNPERVEAVC